MKISIKIQFFILLHLCLIINNSQSFKHLLCSDEFCKNYIEKHNCEQLAYPCRVQNATHNGQIVPAPVPCNCCKTCIQNLHEGDLCTIGEPGMSVPNFACGPNLICKLNEKMNEYRCEKMQHIKCIQDQMNYDNEKNLTGIGSFVQRPICNDNDGFYTSIKCNIDQMCFCVDQNGERIFGESPYYESIEKTMKCECSRLNLNFNKWMNSKYPLLTARCLENGNYDPMQCIHDKCTCVKMDTGIIKYWTTFNSTTITYDKIPCFNNTIHSKYVYLHNCEEKQFAILKQIKESEDNDFIVLDVVIPQCQPDGWYLPLQQNNTHLFCVDKYGRIIDEFIVTKGSLESHNMNCKCARTRNVIIQNLGKNNSLNILPQCCLNGNFKKVQCRKDYCYCSDENGLQIGIEQHVSNITKLNCYNEGKYC